MIFFKSLKSLQPNLAKSNIYSLIQIRFKINSKMELVNWTCLDYFLARIIVYDEDRMKLDGLEGRLVNNNEDLVKFQSFFRVKKIEDDDEIG